MKEILITYFLSYLIIIISCWIYTQLGFHNIDDFLQNQCNYIIIVFFIIAAIFLFINNRRKEKNMSIKDYFPFVYFGISIASFLNMIIFYFFPTKPNNNISFYLLVVSSSIVGPIYEEILFRYCFYNRLKEKYSKSRSIFLSSLVFALIHLKPIKIIYAFVLGMFFSVVYEREKNILVPILMHIGANFVALTLSQFNVYILFLSIINLIISGYLIFCTSIRNK